MADYTGFLATDMENAEDGKPFKARFGKLPRTLKVPAELSDSGQDEYKAIIVDLVVWPGSDAAKTIERLNKSGNPLTKGASLIVTGQERGQQWKDKDGNIRTNIAIVAFTLDFVSSGSKKSSDSSSEEEEGQVPDLDL